MPEHLLYVMIDDENFHAALNIFYIPEKLKERVEEFLDSVEKVPDDGEYDPEVSSQMAQLIENAINTVVQSSAVALDTPHLARGLLQLDDSWAAYLLKDSLYHKEPNFISQLINLCEFDDKMQDMKHDVNNTAAWKKLVTCMNDHYMDYNPLIGRENELRRTIQVLCRRDKNNPLHVGEPGVGKTALVWGLARLIEEGRVPKRLTGSRIYQIDIGRDAISW